MSDPIAHITPQQVIEILEFAKSKLLGAATNMSRTTAITQPSLFYYLWRVSRDDLGIFLTTSIILTSRGGSLVVSSRFARHKRCPGVGGAQLYAVDAFRGLCNGRRAPGARSQSRHGHGHT